MFSSVTIIGIAMILWICVVPSESGVRRKLVRTFQPSARVFPLVLLALVFTGEVQIWTVDWLFKVYGPVQPSWLSALPIRVYDNYFALDTSWNAWGHLREFILIAIQTLLLALLLSSTPKPFIRKHVAMVAAAALALAFESITADVMTSLDPYEYLAAAVMGWKSYSPVAADFRGTVYQTFEYYLPLRGVLYGPLWLAIDIQTMAIGHTVHDKLLALRCLNGVLVLAVAGLAAKYVNDVRISILIAINPAVWFYTVINPHAELEGVLLLLFAAMSAKRFAGWLTVFFVVLAGLIKLPFLICGGITFLGIQPARRRFTLWVIAGLLSFVASLYLCGEQYVRMLIFYTTYHGGALHNFKYGFVVSLTVIAILLVSVALGKRFGSTSFLFGQLLPAAAPHYLIWAWPYALTTSAAIPLLVLFPVMAYLLDPINIGSIFKPAIVCLFLVVIAIDVVYFFVFSNPRLMTALKVSTRSL